MFTTEQARAALDGTVYTTEGEKIGRVGQIYLDDETNTPEWVTVATGLFGSKESFVPLTDAQVEGDRVVVPFDKDKIKGAPQIDADTGHLSQDEERQLYSYYGKSYDEARSDSGLPGRDTTTPDDDRSSRDDFASRDDVTRDDVTSRDDDASTRGGFAAAAAAPLSGLATDRGDSDRGDAADRTVARDTAAGRTPDDASRRLEERLDVGTQRHEITRARLRKYIVTGEQTITVPASNEEVLVITQPITDDNVGADNEGLPADQGRQDTESIAAREAAVEDDSRERIHADDPDSIDLRGERSTTQRTS